MTLQFEKKCGKKIMKKLDSTVTVKKSDTDLVKILGIVSRRHNRIAKRFASLSGERPEVWIGKVLMEVLDGRLKIATELAKMTAKYEDEENYDNQ